MSEGGLLTWKRKSDKAFVNSGQYNLDSMGLPSQPPEGKDWRKNDENQWELFDKQEKDNEKGGFVMVKDPNEKKEEQEENENGEVRTVSVNSSRQLLPSFPPERASLLHKVNRDIDTLEGLCLRYKTNRRTLQNMNNFSGSSLAMAPDVLKVPRQLGAPNRRSSKEAIEAMERANILKRFINLFPTLSQMEARIYLDDTSYDFDVAVKAAQEDLKWEESDKGARAERKHSRFNDRVDQAEQFVKGSKIGEEDQAGKGHIRMVAVAMEEDV
ncbi:hypothetical protein TrLO_g10501 [Triparma laevis f. longispina]|uniref:CUE domain-containing protein n=1 Tax=Triparma laevis f. longispina TaxID=1714387 RepID=A0A9W7FNL4_9STRA|nr:hypothetical protein TrLO_g10501 [Triparma laevis f. longispina]